MPSIITLIPFGPSHGHSSTLLGPVEPTEELREALDALESKYGRDVPLEFNTHLCEDDDEHEPHWGNTQENADGSRLKHVAVSELVAMYGTESVAGSWLAHASWAYISALPDGWRVALYWH